MATVSGIVTHFSAFLPESVNEILALAGLLTYSTYLCLPIFFKTVARIQVSYAELTAAGTVRELHAIPFSSYINNFC